MSFPMKRSIVRAISARLRASRSRSSTDAFIVRGSDGVEHAEQLDCSPRASSWRAISKAIMPPREWPARR